MSPAAGEPGEAVTDRALCGRDRDLGSESGPAFGLGPRRVLLASATAVVVAAIVLAAQLLSGGQTQPAKARYGGTSVLAA
jgi:hypothetical protein